MNSRKVATLFFASAAMLGTGVGSAFADGGQGTLPNTYFTELPGVIAKPATGAATMTTQSHGPSIGAYATTHSTGTWLFPPDPNGGSNS